MEKFLYRTNTFLKITLHKMLSNVFIQLNIDYTYHVQYPNLNEKKKIQITQNKCIYFYKNGIIYPAKSFSQLTGYLSIKVWISA